MKTRHILLILAAIIITTCKTGNEGKKYRMIVHGIEVERSGDVKIDSERMNMCLLNYKSNIESISGSDYVKSKGRYFISIGLMHKEDGVDSGVIEITIYDNFIDADNWNKGRFKSSGKEKFECFKLLPGIDDVAFIPANARCIGVMPLILYANTEIIFNIHLLKLEDQLNPNYYSKEEIDKAFSTEKKYYNDVINDFYPYFRKCAEQAKVPVTPESTK